MSSAIKGKSNKAFMILSALGIIFVLDAHLWTGVSFLSEIFPYDSFFMPMFIFISGYFYNEKYSSKFKEMAGFVWKKTKNILLPYLMWVAFYGIFTAILRKIGVISFGYFAIKDLIPWIFSVGTSFGFNSPAWFVPTLFFVSVFYCIARYIYIYIPKTRWNEWAALVFFIALGAVSIYVARNGSEHYMLLKIAFFTQFFQLGIVFKKYIEPWFDKAKGFYVCLGAILINLILLSIYDNKIIFANCAFMSGFKTNNLILPFLTSVTGIAFWLKISKLLVPVIGDNKLVNYISNNTFFIMTHHLTVKFLFNGFLFIGKKIGISWLQSFSAPNFKADPWYVFEGNPWIKIAAFIFMILVTALLCFIWEKIKESMNFLLKRINNKKTVS